MLGLFFVEEYAVVRSRLAVNIAINPNTATYIPVLFILTPAEFFLGFSGIVNITVAGKFICI